MDFAMVGQKSNVPKKKEFTILENDILDLGVTMKCLESRLFNLDGTGAWRGRKREHLMKVMKGGEGGGGWNRRNDMEKREKNNTMMYVSNSDMFKFQPS